MTFLRHGWQLLDHWFKNRSFPAADLSQREASSTRLGASAQRGSRCRDSGFTLVEVLVATMLMGVGIVGAASVFTLSSQASSAAEHRTQASHLIVSEMEAIRAIPYERAGLDPNDKGFEPSFRGHESVIWTKDPASNINPVSPYNTRMIDGTEYTIVRRITWADTGTDVYLVKKSYKVVNIEIKWADSSGTHIIQQESGLFEGGGR